MPQKTGRSRKQEVLELWVGLQKWGERRKLSSGLVQPQSQSSANLDHEVPSHLGDSNLVPLLGPHTTAPLTYAS